MDALKQDIEKLESVQRTFTSKLNGLQDLNYHERLRALNLYSLQRRRERFCIITIWKIANGFHPNQLNLQFYDTPRFGKKCRRKIYKSKRVHIKTIQHPLAQPCSTVYQRKLKKRNHFNPLKQHWTNSSGLYQMNHQSLDIQTRMEIQFWNGLVVDTVPSFKFNRTIPIPLMRRQVS